MSWSAGTGVGRAPSAEMQLLRLFARAKLLSHDHLRILELLEAGVDWDRVVALARRHRLLPLLGWHVGSYGNFVPSSIEMDLSRAQFSNAVWALDRAAKLIEVIDTLDSADVSAVPYKGPALGAQLYGSGALRIFSDLDVVVRPRSVREARRVLLDLGYVPRTTMTEIKVEFMVRHRYHEALVGEDGSQVELHWSFTNRDIAFDLDLEQAWTRLRSIELFGRTLPTFHPEDLLLMLCVHGAKHRWDHLEWVAGLAELIRQSEDIEWDRLLNRASKLGVHRVVALGLWLAADLLDAPLAPTVVRRIRSDRRLPMLVDYVTGLLDQAPAGWELQERIRRDRFRIMLQERLRDRFRFVWNRAMTPSNPDRWQVARVGRWLLPLHAVRRPFQFFGDLLSTGRTSPNARQHD